MFAPQHFLPRVLPINAKGFRGSIRMVERKAVPQPVASTTTLLRNPGSNLLIRATGEAERIFLDLISFTRSSGSRLVGDSVAVRALVSQSEIGQTMIFIA